MQCCTLQFMKITSSLNLDLIAWQEVCFGSFSVVNICVTPWKPNEAHSWSANHWRKIHVKKSTRFQAEVGRALYSASAL